jgi:hypothetical protein
MRTGRTVDIDGQSPKGRPAWLTQGAIRLAILCAFVALVEMASPRIESDDAGLVVLIGVLLLVGGAVGFYAYGQSLSQRAGDTLGPTLGALRHTGLPLLGLVFFLAWTVLYIGVWWVRPDGAFTGLDAAPRFADFFYYSVSTGMISPPGDIFAKSRGARAATLIEMITALALVTAYLSSFSDILKRRTA